MLIVEPLAGLGNRMRAIDSAWSLAKAIDRPLVVAWKRGPELGAEFLDIFEAVDGIRFTERDIIRVQNPTVFIDQDRITELINANFQFESLREYSTIIIRTWDRFYPSEQPYSIFTPAERLRQDVAKIASKFDETTGVHIRRTDNKPAIANSATATYVDRIRMAVDLGEARSFFLATDDPAEERALRNSFGSKSCLRRNAAWTGLNVLQLRRRLSIFMRLQRPDAYSVRTGLRFQSRRPR